MKETTVPKTPAEIARFLSQISGESVTEEMILADIKAGAPIDSNSHINIVFYLAWLLKHEDDPA